jgi:NAD-dependent dihydropyrimidine dehydrogenase PreA subunit/flavodoxin
MILYFSGTGNSKYVANYLSDKLDDEMVSLNEVIKYNQNLDFTSIKPFIFVSPIYCWRYPKIIEDLISHSNLLGSNEVYCIATMGQDSGKAGKYLKKIVQSKGMIFKGFEGLLMPDNYVFSDKMATSEEIKYIFENLMPVLEDLRYQISKNQFIKTREKTHLASLKSGLINKQFNKYLLRNKVFTISKDCIGCTQCELLCPVNNIIMKDNHPVIGSNCIYCFSCIQHCPKEAINIKGQTENNGRYVCQEYKTK